GVETPATAPRASFVVASHRRAGVGHELVRRRDSQPLRASGAGFVLSTVAGVVGALESSVPQMALAGFDAGSNRVLVLESSLSISVRGECGLLGFCELA